MKTPEEISKLIDATELECMTQNQAIRDAESVTDYANGIRSMYYGSGFYDALRWILDDDDTTPEFTAFQARLDAAQSL